MGEAPAFVVETVPDSGRLSLAFVWSRLSGFLRVVLAAGGEFVLLAPGVGVTAEEDGGVIGVVEGGFLSDDDGAAAGIVVAAAAAAAAAAASCFLVFMRVLLQP